MTLNLFKMKFESDKFIEKTSAVLASTNKHLVSFGKAYKGQYERFTYLLKSHIKDEDLLKCTYEGASPKEKG